MPESQIPTMKREEDLMKALSVINDPEVFVPITDMGLIYGVERVAPHVVKVTMTLTTIGCPLFDVIKESIEEELCKVENITEVVIDLTFDPPWHTGMMTEEIQLDLGLM